MSDRSPDPRSRGLFRLTGAVYWLLVVEVAFLLASSPGLVGILFLDRHPSNLPLYAACTLLIVPAFSAALYTLRARERDDDPVVWRRYRRGWATNAFDVLKVWLPAALVLTLLATNVLFGRAAGVDTVLLVGGGVLAVVVTLWAANAVVIASLFDFRTRDVARLAVYYLFARPLVLLGTAGVFGIAVLVVLGTSEWVLALAGSLLAMAVLSVTRPMVSDIERRFVRPEEDATQ